MLAYSKSTPATSSRAYAKFKSLDALVLFSKALNGKAVKDNAGNESVIQIEFAPYDKIPKNAGRLDPRQGTIDNGMYLCALGIHLTARSSYLMLTK